MQIKQMNYNLILQIRNNGLFSLNLFYQKKVCILCTLKIMKKVFTTILIALASLSFAQDQMQKKDLGKISLSVPADFYEMTEKDIVEQFGMTAIPKAIFTNAAQDVFISVNVKEDTINSQGLVKYKNFNTEYERDLQIEKSFRKSSLRQDFSDLTFISDTAFVVGKANVMHFEFDGKLIGEDQKGEEEVTSLSYYYIMYAFVKKRTYIVNFSCPVGMKLEWAKKAKDIIKSIEAK